MKKRQTKKASAAPWFALTLRKIMIAIAAGSNKGGKDAKINEANNPKTQ